MVGLAFGSFALGSAMRFLLAGQRPTTVHAESGKERKSELSVTSKGITVNGKEVGVVIVNKEEVMRLQASSGGNDPGQRAHVVALRVNGLMKANTSPRSIHIGTSQGNPVIQSGSQPIVTVFPGDASGTGRSQDRLAREWGADLSRQMRRYYSSSGAKVEEWTPEEPYDEKWVPIVSVLEGLKIGGARVNGPRSKLRTVQAVAQLETHFKDYVEIDVYLPISTKVPGKRLDIVSGCAVSGFGDIDL